MNSTRYQPLMARIDAGECILIDGATGTEVERRGVPQLPDAWNGGGALTHPDIVRQIHMDYIESGAEIVISNTFGTQKHALRDAGMEDQFEFLNRRGVELAVEAREALDRPEVLVAGGITHWSWSGNHPPVDELRDNAIEQAKIMANAGAELIMLEMMVTIERLVALTEAGRAAGLPVWAGITCRVKEDGSVYLRDGESLEELVLALNDLEVPLVNLMHMVTEDIDPALDALQPLWDGHIGVYAHTGTFHEDSAWIDKGVIPPADYARAAKGWINRGVQVIGGCCGIGPDHIAALSQMLRNRGV